MRSIAVIFFLVLLSASAHAKNWWGVISYQTATGCVSPPLVKLVSTPFVLPDDPNSPPLNRDMARSQFLAYMYRNRLEDLQKIAGKTMVHWGSMDFDFSPEKVREKAKRAGAYSSVAGCSDTSLSYEVIEIDFKFDPNLVSDGKTYSGELVFGSKEKWEEFQNFFNKKN